MEIENRMPNVTGLVATLNTKSAKIENEISDITNLSNLSSVRLRTN